MTDRYNLGKRTEQSGRSSRPEKKRKTETQLRAIENTYNQTIEAIKKKKGDVTPGSKEETELNELIKEAQICKKHNLLKENDPQYNHELVELKHRYMPGDEKPNGEPHNNWRYEESLADWKRGGKWVTVIQEGRYKSYMDLSKGYEQTIEKDFSRKELENIKQHVEKAIKLYQDVIEKKVVCPEGIKDPQAELKAHEKILEVVEQGISYHKREIEIGISAISENLSSLDRTKVILRQEMLLEKQLTFPEESKENLIFERAKEVVNYLNRSDRLTENPASDTDMALKQAQELHERIEKEYPFERLKEITNDADNKVQSNNNIIEQNDIFKRIKRPDSIIEKARAERDFYQHVSKLSKQGIDYYDADKENIGVEDIAKKLDKLKQALQEINSSSEGEDISVETFNRSKGILEATDSKDNATNMDITDLPRADYIRDAAYTVYDPFKEAKQEIYPLSEDLRETWKALYTASDQLLHGAHDQRNENWVAINQIVDQVHSTQAEVSQQLPPQFQERYKAEVKFVTDLRDRIRLGMQTRMLRKVDQSLDLDDLYASPPEHSNLEEHQQSEIGESSTAAENRFSRLAREAKNSFESLSSQQQFDILQDIRNKMTIDATSDPTLQQFVQTLQNSVVLKVAGMIDSTEDLSEFWRLGEQLAPNNPKVEEVLERLTNRPVEG